MKRLSLVAANQTIALLIFTAASVLPLYSQEGKTSQKAQAARSTSEQTSEGFKQSDAKSSGETAKDASSRQVDSSQASANQPTSKGYFDHRVWNKSRTRIRYSLVVNFASTASEKELRATGLADRKVRLHGGTGSWWPYARRQASPALKLTLLFFALCCLL